MTDLRSGPNDGGLDIDEARLNALIEDETGGGRPRGRRGRSGGGRRRRAGGSGRRRLRWFLMLVILGLVWLIGLFAFVWLAVPKDVADDGRATDVIVVLTGGSGRLEKGFELLAAGRSEAMFISGVYRGVEVVELMQLSAQTPQEVECCVTLGYNAADTHENALETRDWAVAEGHRSLRLVTANYHMPRSLYEFRRAMPDAEIIPHPVTPQGFLVENWWSDGGALRIAAMEYTKFLIAHVAGAADDAWRFVEAKVREAM